MNTKLLSLNFPENVLVREARKKGYPSIKFRKGNANKLKELSVAERVKLVIEGQSSKMSISDFCLRNKISLKQFSSWTHDYLTANSSIESEFLSESIVNDDLKWSVVKEAKSGVKSVAEICRREEISQDVFLNWCNEYRLQSERSSILRKLNGTIYRRNVSLLSKELNNEEIAYFENYVDFNSNRTNISKRIEDDLLGNFDSSGSIVSLQKLNDVRFINKHLESINSKMDNNGIFIGCFETFSARRNAMTINKFPLVGNLYFPLEFLFKRILPKVSFTKKFYFDFTKGRDRLLSKAEGLGRLVSCGFKIMDFKTFDGKLYFVVKKIREPYFDVNPSYGPIYKMSRLGKNGNKIGVYKFRTMHPYSEYLQDYIVNAYGYADTGKPANDFRIPKWGKFMRKFWLDEIPQLFNVLKGELKLVGVRPVSERYFQDIPKEMQKLRNTQKPGCIPPYVALNREGNVMSVLQSEKDYLVEKMDNPYFTDLKYFFKAIFNIIIRHKRSA